MLKGVFLLFLIVTSFFIQSCSICSCKKYACPAFQNDKVNEWMMGFSNQRVLYSNNASGVDTFTLEPVQISGTYEAKKGCPEGDRGCLSSFVILSSEYGPTGTPKFAVSFDSFTGWDNQPTLRILIHVKDLEVHPTDITSTGFIIPDPHVQTAFNPSVTLNGKAFTDVQLIQVDTSTKTSGVYKFYLARNNGLIAYEEYPSHNLWIRQ